MAAPVGRDGTGAGMDNITRIIYGAGAFGEAEAPAEQRPRVQLGLSDVPGEKPKISLQQVSHAHKFPPWNLPALPVYRRLATCYIATTLQQASNVFNHAVAKYYTSAVWQRDVTVARFHLYN